MAKEKEPIKLLLTRDTKAPVRKKDDAGIDVFIPNLTEDFVEALVKANPGQPVKWGVVGSPSDAKENQSDEDKQNSGMYIYMPPHEDLLIPIGIKSLIPEGQLLKVENRSSVAMRQKLITGACIIDRAYQGEICIHVINFSSSMKFLSFGQKLCQLVPYKYNDEDHENFYVETIEKYKEYKNLTTEEKFYPEKSERGNGGFGSTGNN